MLVVSHIAFDTVRFDRLWRLEGGLLVEGASSSAPSAPATAAEGR